MSQSDRSRLFGPWTITLPPVCLPPQFYFYAKDGGTRFGRFLGATLRCILLVLLLVLIWQPVLRFDQSHREPGVVAVLVDVSRSMNSHDPYALDDPLVTELASLDSAGKPTTQPAGQPAVDPAAQAAALRRVFDKSRMELVGEMLNGNHREALHALLANNDVPALSLRPRPLAGPEVFARSGRRRGRRRGRPSG